MTCWASGSNAADPWFATPQTPCVVWMSAGVLVTGVPSGWLLPRQQLPGVCRPLMSPKSPLVGLPKKPLWLIELRRTRLPQSS